MKLRLFALAAGVLLAAGSASAAITVDGVIDGGYGAAVSTDAIQPAAGEGGAGPNAVMDLQDLYAVFDSGTLYVAVSINADITATNWGKYVVYIDTGAAIAGSGTTDQWGRAISSTGSDYQFHCWVDGPGGAGFNAWDNGTTAWVGGGAGTSFAFDGGQVPSVVEIGIPQANLGGATSVNIAAVSTGGGGGDNGQDTVPTAANATDWGTTTNIASFVTVTAPAAVTDWTMLDE